VLFQNKKLVHVLGFVISAIFIYLVFRNTDLLKIYRVISGLDVAKAISIPLLTLLIIAIKTSRWQLLLGKSEHVSYKKLLSINYASCMFNIVLPFRAGEIIQVFLTKGHTRTGKSNIAGSIVLNKFLEILSILLIFYTLVSFIKIPLPALWLEFMKYLTIFAIIFLILFAFRIIDCNKIKGPKNKILNSVYSFFCSLNHISDKKLLFKTLLISFFIWSVELLKIYIMLSAFNITMPLWGTILVLVGINLAMVIPATSGSFGPYEFSVILVLGLFHVTKEAAIAFAITFHFLEVLLVLLIGLVCYACLKDKVILKQEGK